MEKDRTIELIVLMMFVVLIGILIIVFMNFSESKINTTTNTHTTITNSFNKVQQDTTPKIYHYQEKCWNKKCYPPEPKKIYYKKTLFPDYDVWGNHKKEKRLDIYYIDTFEVYVKNHGKSDYFIVRFYFEDCWDEEKIYDIKHYVYSGETKKFYFRDINKDDCEYNKWKYRIVP